MKARRDEPPSLYTFTDCRPFPGSPDQPREARLWARALVRPYPDVADAVELVVSELFTNAIEHTASGEKGGIVFCSIVGLVYGTIHLEVTDQGQRSDRPRTAARVMLPEPESTSGRGLFLTSVLAKEWGRLPAEDGPGYAERGYTSICHVEPNTTYAGPMVTWAEFPTTNCQ